MSAKCDIKWMWDLLAGNKSQNAADHQFLQNNGLFYKLFDKLLILLGKGFKGGDGWHSNS